MVPLWGKNNKQTPIYPLFCFNGIEENAKLGLSMHKEKLQNLPNLPKKIKS